MFNNFPYFFGFWLFLFPLVTLFGVQEVGVLTWFYLGGISAICFWIYILFKKHPVKLNSPDKFYLIFLIILASSSLFGIHPVKSLIGGSVRFQGIVFFVTLFLTTKIIDILNKKQKQILVKIIALSVLLELIIVLVQFFIGNVFPFPSRLGGRIVGTLKEPNSLGGFFVLGCYFIAQQKLRFKLVNIFLLFLILFVIGLTVSRSAIVSVNFIIIFYILTKFISKRFYQKTVKYVVIFVLSILTIFSIKQISLLRQPSIYENRSLIWRTAMSAIISRPILGYGAESGEAVLTTQFVKNNIKLHGFVFDRAHNLFLDVLIWSGIMGLIGFSLWLISNIKQSLINKDLKKVITICGFLIFSMFQPVNAIHWLYLMVIIYI